MTTNKIEFIYFQVTDLWKRLCELHTTLLDYTCAEYALLLQSEIEKLEDVVQEKEKVIAEINGLEELRQELVAKTQTTTNKKVTNISELLTVMQNYEIETEQKHLFRFNELLIDIIEKIQTQNKKNQMFINRALLSLKEIREEAAGKKDYSTYTSRGATTVDTKGSVLT